MCTTVLDEVPGKRATIIGNLLSFLKSDTACLRHPDKEVAAAQGAQLDPLVSWFQEEFNMPLRVDNSFVAEDQPEETAEALQWHLFKCDNWTLCALEALAQSTKSLVLALAVWRGRLTAAGALAACSVEEAHNRALWGRVDGTGGHDVDEADLQQRVGTPAVLLRLYNR